MNSLNIHLWKKAGVLLLIAFVLANDNSSLSAIRNVSVNLYNFECGSPQYISFRITASGTTNDINGFDMLSYRITDGVGNLIQWDTFGIGASEINRLTDRRYPVLTNVVQNPVTFTVYEAVAHADFGAVIVSSTFHSPCVAAVNQPHSPTNPTAVSTQPPQITIYCASQSPVGSRTGRVTANPVANVRSGAGTSFSRIGQASLNCYFEIVGEANGWYQVNLGGGATGWISGDWLEIPPVTSICRYGWTPATISDGINVWVPLVDYSIRLQDLRMAERTALNTLIATVWWREIRTEITDQSLESVAGYLFPRLGNFVQAAGFAATLIQVGRTYFAGSVTDARQIYRNNRIFREELEQYDTDQHRCGNWLNIPIMVWDRSNVTSFGNPIYFLRNFLPVDAAMTCAEFPDTCSLFE